MGHPNEKTAEREPRPVKVIRKLRHWRQRFDANSAFVWRRTTVWDGVTYEPGELITDEILAAMGRTKLRRFWESHRIELAHFDDAAGRLVEPDAMPDVAAPAQAIEVSEVVEPGDGVDLSWSITEIGGSWFLTVCGGVEKKIRGIGGARRRVIEFLVTNGRHRSDAERAVAGDETPAETPSETAGDDPPVTDDGSGGADTESPAETTTESAEAPRGAFTVEDVGGSWYAVTIDGETTKVRGKSAVESLTGQPFEPEGGE